ncbi:hypothetical protein A2U01_0082628, partial [Trifolium medium]|nr:hypothetical protein [Trifolium medium]
IGIFVKDINGCNCSACQILEAKKQKRHSQSYSIVAKVENRNIRAGKEMDEK